MLKINGMVMRFAYAVGGCKTFVIVLVALLLSEAGHVNNMYTIPAEFEMWAIPFIIGFAIIFCVCMYIWRYAEHNDENGLDRSTNKQKAKFIVGVILAIAITAFLGYVGSCVAVNWIHPADVGAADYIICAFPIELIAGLALTIIISEGITGLGKFVKQKVKEDKEAVADVKDAIDGVSPEVVQAIAAAILKAIPVKEEQPAADAAAEPAADAAAPVAAPAEAPKGN